MARIILSGIEEIIYQRMGIIQATNSQFSFFSQFLPVWRFPAQAGSTCPGQEHRTGSACQRGCTGTGLKSLASCCICQWLNTGSWTRHSPGYFKPALLCVPLKEGLWGLMFLEYFSDGHQYMMCDFPLTATNSPLHAAVTPGACVSPVSGRNPVLLGWLC